MLMAYMQFSGDPSAGILPYTLKAETGLEEFIDMDDREEARSLFQRLYATLLDEDPGVFFSDECPDCLYTTPGHHKDCPNQSPDPEPRKAD